jgi:beta-galactosidase
MPVMKRRPSFEQAALIAVLLVAALISCSRFEPRERTSFNNGWKFSLSGDDGAMKSNFDDSGWRMLDLPHDWSIEGTFSDTNKATPGGGALPGGIGWYRKTFTIDLSQKNKLIYVEFDGVYRNSEVWINDNYLGKRPYGYSSFRYNLTPYIHYGNEKNIIAVKVDNSQQPNSRWYSGSGIYRNVWLVSTGKIAVDHWGTFVTTPEITEKYALIRISTRISNNTGSPARVTLFSTIYNAENKKVASVNSPDIILNDTIAIINQDVSVSSPVLWSVENPYLYRIVTEIRADSDLSDRYETVTGIRSFIFDSDRGFILNGKPVKILGVCDHHDLGCLGAAINTRAIERQLEMLKEMGCNAIRTSHNPPAPELLDLCDRMGFIVMDEAFDMWKTGKTPFDYSLDWDGWHRKDIEAMVLRDRNHPSVFIWSIGNEVMEQWQRDGSGEAIATELAGIVHALDDTRPVTSACNDPYPHNPVIASGALDLIGYNYHDTSFVKFPQTFPGKKFIASETTSALATRGSYDMPSDIVRRWPARWEQPFTDGNPDLTCSSYDNCSAPWGSTHEETWKVIKAHDYLSGMFIWTGWDYLGEPTPYWWPARSSYFGIIDLAGFPKDAYWFYQSEWTDKTVLHIFPHWNWNPGQTVDVWAYTNCDEVELFLNGTSLGKKKKGDGEMHLMWRVSYEAGTITAMGYRNGTELIRKEVKTADQPAAIILSPDRQEISADGSDLSFIQVTVVDKNNVTVPYADNLIKFSVEGSGSVAGVDNGNQASLEPFKADFRRAFHGKCLVVVRGGSEKGTIKVTASSEGLAAATTDLQVR